MHMYGEVRDNSQATGNDREENIKRMKYVWVDPVPSQEASFHPRLCIVDNYSAAVFTVDLSRLLAAQNRERRGFYGFENRSCRR